MSHVVGDHAYLSHMGPEYMLKSNDEFIASTKHAAVGFKLTINLESLRWIIYVFPIHCARIYQITRLGYENE